MSRWILLITATYLLLGGAISLAGWLFDIPKLTDWDGDGISIQPNATLCVVFSGFALLSLWARWTLVARCCGAAVLLVGSATLVEWIGGISFGIDDLLMFSHEWGRVGVVYPGRMGPPGSLAWTLLGTALIATTVQGQVRRLAPALCLLTTALSFLSLTGYLYGADPLYSHPYLTVIALQTSTFVLAASIGVFACHPESEPSLTLRENSTAGLLARRAAPVILLLPPLLGYLRLAGEDAGLYGTQMGVAMLVLSFTITLAILVWRALRAVRNTTRRQEQQREFLERLIESSPVAIAVVRGPGLRYEMLNAAYRSIAGPTKHPAIGAAYADIFPEAAALGVAERVRQVIETGTPWKMRNFRTPIGNRPETWWEGEVLALDDADGRRDSALILTWDISDRKQSEKRIFESEQALRDANRRKDEFLATLAHELRNPLAPVRNVIHVLRSKGQSALPWGQEILDRQVRNMARLIDDLMDVSRISQGKLDLQRSPTELRQVIESAVEASRSLIEEHGHELTLVLPEQPVRLDADPTRLSQVFSNLINNACRYSDSGGRIVLKAVLDGQHVNVSVQDNGIGIPPEKLTEIFELFAQVDQSLEKSRGGLGVGLSLVKRLVELHGGQVDAHSDGIGRGSTFTVRLPVLASPVLDAGAGDEACASAPIPITAHRVLVVDDNRDAADTLSALLRSTGNDVRTAYDGDGGIRVAEEFRPGIVLLDIGLPKVNGYDVGRAIRATSWGKTALLVAVTGWGQDGDRNRSRDAGFDHHLVKPVSPEAIMELVAAVPSPVDRRQH